MPVELEWDDVERRCTFRLVGCVSLHEVIAARTAQAAGGRWTYASIVDATQRTRTPTTEDLRELRAQIEGLSIQHGPLGPVAMIAPTNAGYGMGRMYEVFAQPLAFAVFRRLEEAERWLTTASARSAPSESRVPTTTIG